MTNLALSAENSQETTHWPSEIIIVFVDFLFVF